MSKEEHFQILKELVELTEGNENACRDALLPFADILTPPGDHVFYEKELPSDEGRTDLIVIVDPLEHNYGSNLLRNDRIAYVFELKAPNKAPYKFDTNSKRFIPSSSLSLAETQLLNYTKRMMEGSSYWAIKYGVSQILVGGIIIGSNAKFFEISETARASFNNADEYLRKLKNTNDARKRILYRSSGLQLYTWDTVLELISKKHSF